MLLFSLVGAPGLSFMVLSSLVFIFGECNLFKDFLIGMILTNNPQGLIWVIFVMDTNTQGLVSELPSKSYRNCFVAA